MLHCVQCWFLVWGCFAILLFKFLPLDAPGTIYVSTLFCFIFISFMDLYSHTSFGYFECFGWYLHYFGMFDSFRNFLLTDRHS